MPLAFSEEKVMDDNWYSVNGDGKSDEMKRADQEEKPLLGKHFRSRRCWLSVTPLARNQKRVAIRIYTIDFL